MGTVIHLPGVGAVDMDARRIHSQVQEYDERLLFDRNLETGNWTVWIKMEHGHAPIPVLVFGRDVPNPDDVMRQLHQSDTKRHGDEILRAMNEHNAEIEREKRRKWENIIGQTAEVAESYAHREGLTPYHRSLRKRDPKHRNSGA